MLASVVHAIWRCLPTGIKDRIRKSPPVIKCRAALSRRQWRDRPHDQVYDNEYFGFVDKTTKPVARLLADDIVAACHPRRVIDVGCGTGALLEAIRERGVDVFGLERATAGIEACQNRGINVLPFDIVADDPPKLDDVDVVISMAVGQQLPTSAAQRYVNLLTSFRCPVVFASDSPGGGDRNPLNEQPHEFWIGLFNERRFSIDEKMSELWRERWRAQGVPRWFYEDVMLFRPA
jgi:SAM-dependent methyltransferase